MKIKRENDQITICDQLNWAWITIKINGAGTIRVDFLDHHVQIFVRDFIVQFFEDLSQNGRCDVAIPCIEKLGFFQS